mmetsp:Transcript_9623/g.21370  ORF Transcript_9623/g.21370 Transcript_9623/m.21370 type:complete len:91 (+) Transcript_9623:1874-2146(+)
MMTMMMIRLLHYHRKWKKIGVVAHEDGGDDYKNSLIKSFLKQNEEHKNRKLSGKIQCYAQMLFYWANFKTKTIMYYIRRERFRAESTFLC